MQTTVSLFPQLFNYGFLATAILRATLGLIFIWLAYAKFFPERQAHIKFFEGFGLKPAVLFFAITNSLVLIAGILLMIGLFTQAAALATGVLMTITTLIKWRNPNSLPKNTIDFYILLAIVSFSLMFIGPGTLALDFPL